MRARHSSANSKAVSGTAIRTRRSLANGRTVAGARARLASAHQHQNPKENRPAIRESQVEGMSMRLLAQSGALPGVQSLVVATGRKTGLL